MDDGLYFGLDFATYKAERRFSASGTKLVLQSQTDFWVRSWMNPDPPDDDTDSKDRGTAYHCRIVEGAAAFRSRYAAKINPEDYVENLDAGDKLLVTVDDLKQFLRDNGQPLGGKKQDLVDRAVAVDSEVLVWDRILEDYEDEHAGKTMIEPKTLREIEIAAVNIEKHPQLKNVFVNGMPEVSVFWTASVTLRSGEVVPVPMKARFDYLKDTAVIDLKSFANNSGDGIALAVYRAMASFKYHTAAAIYYEASDALAKLIQDGRVFGDNLPSRKWLDSVVKHTPDRSFFFVFQQTGPAPVAVGRRFRRGLSARETGHRDWEEAMEKFVEAQRLYGDEVWVTVLPTEDFEDDEFPPWTWAR